MTTVDIDSEVTGRARRCLAAAGYDDIEVICADAEFALAPGRMFDAIIVTAGAWDVPAAWSVSARRRRAAGRAAADPGHDPLLGA